MALAITADVSAASDLPDKYFWLGGTLNVQGRLLLDDGTSVQGSGVTFLFRWIADRSVQIELMGVWDTEAGVWRCAAELARSGPWEVRLQSQSPQRQSDWLEILIAAAPGAEVAPQGSVLVTQTGNVLVTQTGGGVTGSRIADLPVASSATGVAIPGFDEDGKDVQVPFSAISDAAGQAAASSPAVIAEAGRLGAEAGAASGADAAWPVAETVGSAAGTTAANAVVANSALKDFGSPASRPFVVLVSGESNAVGAGGARGDMTVDQSGGGVFISNAMRAGTGMVRAIFGQTPLTGDNLFAPHIANAIRRSGRIDANRPIWIIMNALGGQSVGAWVAQGTSSPLWLDLLTSLTGAQTAWAAAGYAGIMPIDATAVAQGFNDDNTASAYNSDDLWVGGQQQFQSQLFALPNWSSLTQMAYLELGRWAAVIENGSLVSPSNKRNAGLYRLISISVPKVSLVSAAGIPRSMDVGDANHYEGAYCPEIGSRFSGNFLAMAPGQGMPFVNAINTRGDPDIHGGKITCVNGTFVLSVDDLAWGANIECANADVRFPALPSTFSWAGTIEVYSASTSQTIIRPANDLLTLGTDIGLQSTVSLGVGLYDAYVSRGRLTVTSKSPRVGGYLVRARGNETLGAIVNPTLEESRGLIISAFNNRIGLPTAVSGMEVSVVCRSLTGGTTVVGRAVNNVMVAAGGSGYMAGDVIQLPLGSATGDAAQVRVLTVDGAGAVLTSEVASGGSITSATLPPTPTSGTGGAGAGATFSVTYSSAIFAGPVPGQTSASYTLDTVGQVVRFTAAAGAWQVVDSRRASPAPGVEATALTPGAITAAQIQASKFLSAPAGAYVLPSPNTVVGFAVNLLATGAITLDTTSSGIYDLSGNVVFNGGSPLLAISTGQTIVLMPGANSRWVIVGGTYLTKHAAVTVTPASGATTTIQKNRITKVAPAGTLAALPLAIQSSAAEGDWIEIVFKQAVTSLTWTALTPVGAPSSAAVGTRLRYEFIGGEWI